MAGIDVTSFALFLVGLAITLGVIVAATFFAMWLRTKLVWSPAGRLLYRLGMRNANGTVNDFRKGRVYVVAKSFTDHYGGRFEAGERLTFVRHDFLPYHGGHTVEFEERTIYLQEEENAEVLQKIWAYIEPARG